MHAIAPVVSHVGFGLSFRDVGKKSKIRGFVLRDARCIVG